MKRTTTQSIIVGVNITCMFFITLTIKAQELAKSENISPSPFFKINKEKTFTPVVAIESWATYSIGENKNEYANRADVLFRRFRFGGSGTPYSWLKYSFQLHLDRLGQDIFASTKGSYKGLDIWNAYITAKLLKNSDFLNLHAGYFWAAISREFNTSPWAVGSLDKTQTNWYMRNFITGKGNGIENGIGLGGLKNVDKFGVSYRIATYEPQLYANTKYSSRLYTGRIMFSIGDAEETAYKFMLSGNQWCKRNGVSIGFGASSQSNGKLTDTSFFNQSIAYGSDILINYKGIRIDSEYFILKRTATNTNNFEGSLWHIRAGYNVIAAGTYIETAITYEKYEGKKNKSLYKYTGNDTSLDIGINWYINKDKLKFAVHYIVQDGSASPNKGDYAGIACQIKL